MKRTIPGGRVESIYTQSENKKEVIANKIISDTEEIIEDSLVTTVQEEEEEDNE